MAKKVTVVGALFYCCFVTFCWRKYEFSAINLLGFACFLVVHHRHWVEIPVNAVSLFNDGLPDGVTGIFIMCSSITCFVWYRTLIYFCAFFSYIVRIICDGLLTLSRYLFLIVCWVLLLDKKHQHLGVYLVYAPTKP